MKCPNCGCEFEEGIFCPECGTRVVVDTVSSEPVNAQPEPHEESVAPEPVEDTTPITAPKEETPVREAASTASDIKQDECPKKKEKASKPAKAPKEKKEKKKGGCLRPVLIILAVVIVLLIIIMMIPTGSSSSSSSSTSGTKAAEETTAKAADDENEITVAEDENPTEEESYAESEYTVSEEKDHWMPEFSHGVSSNYNTSYVRMVSPDDVIADFNEEGFEYVYLENHDVSLGDGDGYAGTGDTMYLICTHADENELWYITEGIDTYYAYWGDGIGTWLRGQGTGDVLDCSFEGFDGSYWGVLADNSNLLDLADKIFGDELNILKKKDFSRDYDYDHYVEDLNIEMFLYLDNFQYYEASLATDYEHYLDNYKKISFSYDANIIPSIKVTLVVEGDVYEKTITPGDASYTCSEGRMFFNVDSQDGVDTGFSLCYNSSVTKDMGPSIFYNYMVYMTESEYSKEIQTAIETGELATEAAQKAGEITYANPYEREYAKVLDAIDERKVSGYYCLYDINGNGICELIVGIGTNEDNFTNTVYTNQGPDYDYTCIRLGSIDGSQTFYAAPDGNGIYAVYNDSNHEVITRLTLAELAWALEKEEISDSNNNSLNSEDYYNNDMLIEKSDIADRTLMQQVTASMYSDESDITVEENDSSSKDGSLSNSANTDYILPDSDSRYYSTSELSGLTKDELRIARNEIYARHGRIFDSEDLNEYFNSKSWYNGTIAASQFSEDLLNDYEKENAKTIQSVENSK